jgi:hypothetical protein
MDPGRLALKLDLSQKLERIEGMFTGPVKVTLMIRHTDLPDHSRDIVIGNDYDREAAMALLEWGLHPSEEAADGE